LVIPRYESDPLFADIDLYLRKFGFHLFDIHKEQWIRQNQIFGLRSKPQLMWGNAIYFLSKEEFFKRLSDLSPSQQKRQLTKFLALLLAYRFHDYAVEIFEECAQKKIADPQFCSTCIEKIRASAALHLRYFLVLLASIGIGLMAYLFFYPIPSHRAKVSAFLKKRAHRLSLALLNFTRDGPFRVAISDHDL
jgi:hypothetical protein